MSLRLRALFVVHAGTIPSSDEDGDDGESESVGEDASADSNGQEDAGGGSNSVDDSGSHSSRNSDAGLHGPGSPAISRHSPASNEGTTTRKSGGGGSDGSGAGKSANRRGETTALAPARQVSGRRAQARARNPPNVVEVTPSEARSMVCAAAARRVIELCSGALGIKVPPVVLAGSYRQMHRCAVPWPRLRRMAWAEPGCCSQVREKRFAGCRTTGGAQEALCHA